MWTFTRLCLHLSLSFLGKTGSLWSHTAGTFPRKWVMRQSYDFFSNNQNYTHKIFQLIIFLIKKWFLIKPHLIITMPSNRIDWLINRWVDNAFSKCLWQDTRFYCYIESRWDQLRNSVLTSTEKFMVWIPWSYILLLKLLIAIHLSYKNTRRCLVMTNQDVILLKRLRKPMRWKRWKTAWRIYDMQATQRVILTKRTLMVMNIELLWVRLWTLHIL